MVSTICTHPAAPIPTSIRIHSHYIQWSDDANIRNVIGEESLRSWCSMIFHSQYYQPSFVVGTQKRVLFPIQCRTVRTFSPLNCCGKSHVSRSRRGHLARCQADTTGIVCSKPKYPNYPQHAGFSSLPVLWGGIQFMLEIGVKRLIYRALQFNFPKIIFSEEILKAMCNCLKAGAEGGF